MPEHRIQEATFDLPEGLRDNTFHSFALSDKGPNEFNLVISRAADIEENDVASFVAHLLRELQKGLPKFQLRAQSECLVGDAPAMTLVYTWRQDGAFIEQRQTVALVKDEASSRPTALMITGTCQKSFNEEWDAAYDKLIASMVLTAPWPHDAPDEVPLVALPAADPGPAVESVFAYRDGLLHVLADTATRDALISPVDVAWGRWKFFASNGVPLHAQFIDDPSAPHVPKAYALEPSNKAHDQYLGQILGEIHSIVGSTDIQSVAALRTHLDRQAVQRHLKE